MVFDLSEEQRMIQEMTRNFAQKEVLPKAAELDETGRFPEELVRQMAELGLMGVAVPEGYGGAGMDNICYAIAMEEISRACASTAVILSVNNSLACDPILKFGSEEQKKNKGITAFILDMKTDGVTVGKNEKKMGITASATASIILEDVRIPVENRLANEGDGFKVAMHTLDGGRIGIASQAIGIARASLEDALAYAKERKQFGQPIANFQAIQWMLADMATEIDAARLLTYPPAWL